MQLVKLVTDTGLTGYGVAMTTTSMNLSSGFGAATPATPPTPARPRRGLFVLAAATFIGVTTELVPVGLLPAISRDLGASEAAVGTTVSGYALVVALTAAPLTAATARWPRRRLLLAVLGLYAASSAVSALAPSLLVLLVGRTLGGLCHGVFWSMVTGYAARLVRPELVGRGTAAVFTGSALAVAAGLPLSTVVGNALGWRATFVGTCAATVLVAVLTRAWLAPLPALPRPASDGAGAVSLLRSALARRGVRAVVVMTAVVVLGHYVYFSYVTVYLADLGASRGTTSTALLAYGVAGVAATVLLSRASAWSAYHRLLVVCVTLLAALTVLATLPLVGHGSWVVVTAVVATAVLGGAAISVSFPLQELVFTHAGPAPDAASSLFVGAFNLGISGGALLGGLLLETSGSGLLPLVAVVIAAAGVLYARQSPIVSRPR